MRVEDNRQRNERFRYGSVFALSSFQFCGHVDEYLIANSRRLCLMYVQPRFGTQSHIVRQYENGNLVFERELPSSQNVFLYYWLWFWHHNVELLRFARSSDHTVVFGGHPICFFGMSFLKLLRKLSYVYWIGDYFPDKSIVIKAFEAVKRFYNARVSFAYYLSNAINSKMNGRVVNDQGRCTLMWGMKQRIAPEAVPKSTSKRLLFVGLLRHGQGIDTLLDFITKTPEYSLYIVGVAANGYENEIVRMIAERNLNSRVYFPNRFHTQEELDIIAKESFAGLALYSTSADNLTHYADPGKVKAYLEMGLPVIMTRISEVVPYIEHYKAGEVVESASEIGGAVARIASDYDTYAEGVRRFNDHFEYHKLYAEAFGPVEAVWK